jgi:hypothetical protein
MTRDFHRTAVTEAVCERLAAGEPLAAICRDEGMPTTRTFLRWADEDEEVELAYRRAREAQAEWLDAEIQRVSETAKDKDTAAAARVRITALTWRASKQAPKRYGDRLDVAVDASLDLGAIIDRGRQRVLEARRANDPALPPREAGEGD